MTLYQQWSIAVGIFSLHLQLGVNANSSVLDGDFLDANFGIASSHLASQSECKSSRPNSVDVGLNRC